ncbi:hypothetical protein [Arthrobacter sp. SD76]|uniref:hypothetical protein n=1 Tax=Arthrobacter sp. SD76 TaxID=3415007 RepID=UPI003C78769F
MENPDTLVLNLTFLGTVGVAFLMFFILFLLGVITLVLAGVGRLAAIILMGLFGWRPRKESIPLVQLYGTRVEDRKDTVDGGAAAAPASGPARPGLLARAFGKPAAGQTGGSRPRDWRAALKPAHLRTALRTAVDHHPALTAARREPPVLAEDWASAVAEADARAIARARAAAPEIKLSVRDLPDPRVPAEKWPRWPRWWSPPCTTTSPCTRFRGPSRNLRTRQPLRRWTPGRLCPWPARRTC